MGIEVDVNPVFLYWTLANLFDEKDEDEDEGKRKREKRKTTTRSSDPIQSTPFSPVQSCYTPQFMQTSSSHLVSPFFLSSSSLAFSVTGITSRKALFSPSYKSSYFLSFGTDLLRDFLYIPFVYGLPNWEGWCVPMLILFVDVDFVIVDVVVVSIVIVTSWLLATGLGLGWEGEW